MAKDEKVSTGLLSRVAPIALFIAVLSLYISTLAPGMLRGDSGEFQWAMASLNVAHATGYPLYTLIGHAWLAIPLPGEPAWRLNLLSALFGAAAVTALFLFARSLTRQPAAAMAAALFFALAPVFWFNASILEVYTLNALLLILILYLVWRWEQCRSSVQPAERNSADLYLYIAFFLIGLALAHHRMTILIGPGLLIYFLLVDRRFFFHWRRLLLLALMVLPGLLLYIYVPLRLLAAGSDMHYAIFDIILGQEFAASLRMYPDPLYVLIRVPLANFHIGLAIAAVGAIVLWRRARNLALLIILVYLADVVFALFYTVPDVEVFLTPSFVAIALWIALGIAWLGEQLSVRLSRRPRVALAVGLSSILLSFFSLTQYSAMRAQVAAEAGGKEERARALFATNLPRGALLELDWETATAVRFLQAVEGTRTDLEARLIKENERDEYFQVLKNVDAGRPVYVESGVKWVRSVAGYRVKSASVELVQLLRTVATIQPAGGSISDNVQLIGYQSNSRGLTLYWKTRARLDKDLATFIHYFDAAGAPLGQEDHAACCQAVFGYRTTEWEPGRTMADAFGPAPTETAFMQIGMYSLNADDLNPYGKTVYIQTRPVSIPTIARPSGRLLGGQVRLSAYQLTRNGGTLEVTLYWDTLSAISAEYTVFVHLLDANGVIAAQADHVPFKGIYPTSAWQPGQIIQDTFSIPDKPNGAKIELGMYEPSSGKRLGADGQNTIIIEVK